MSSASRSIEADRVRERERGGVEARAELQQQATGWHELSIGGARANLRKTGLLGAKSRIVTFPCASDQSSIWPGMRSPRLLLGMHVDRGMLDLTGVTR